MMPRYFFNIRHRPGAAGLALAEEALELADVTAAREYALSEAREMIAHDRLTMIRDWMDCSFEITDEAGRHVMIVPFTDLVSDVDSED